MEKTSVEVVVSRKQWIRGNPKASSLLVSGVEEAGKMCCLGFAARKAGLRACDISGQGHYAAFTHWRHELPPLGAKLQKKFPKLFQKDLEGRWRPTILHDDLTAINDTREMREDHREERLRETGLMAGIRFIFVD